MANKNKIHEKIERLESWNLILTIALIIIFVLLLFSMFMMIKIDSGLNKTKDFSENNWDWIQKFYGRILKIEGRLEKLGEI